jgi:hypothetical protein
VTVFVALAKQTSRMLGSSSDLEYSTAF